MSFFFWQTDHGSRFLPPRRCCEERIPGKCVMAHDPGSVHDIILQTGDALSCKQEMLCERLEKGAGTAAAALIRQQAHEIDDLWDRVSRAYARSESAKCRIASIRPQTKGTSFGRAPALSCGSRMTRAKRVCSNIAGELTWRHCSSHAPPPVVEFPHPKSLAAAWRKTLKVECPHCGEMHRVSVREAYIAFAVQDGTSNPIVFDRSPGVAPGRPRLTPRRARQVKGKNVGNSPSP